MFFLYVLSPLFILTYIYSKYFSNYKNQKKLTFSDFSKNKTFILLTIEQYSSDFKEVHSIIYNKKCNCKNKIKIDNLDSLNIKESNQAEETNQTLESNNNFKNYNIVNYIYDNKTYKALIKENSFEFPIINEVKNYVYLNKIKSAEIVYEENSKSNKNIKNTQNITEILLDYIGPNYDFNYETEYKQNINEILNIEKLINNNNNNYKIKLIDNFDNEVYIKDTLVWKASII